MKDKRFPPILAVFMDKPLIMFFAESGVRSEQPVDGQREKGTCLGPWHEKDNF